jgi:hypothetical protein
MVEFGLTGHFVDGTSEFDGTDPVTFRRADTLDATDNRIYAVRGGEVFGTAAGPCSWTAATSTAPIAIASEGSAQQHLRAALHGRGTDFKKDRPAPPHRCGRARGGALPRP